MKTRSAPIEPPNIAASVKARRNARIGSPFRISESNATSGEEANSNPSIIGASTNMVTTVVVADKPMGEDSTIKTRPSGQKLLKQSWTVDDRRLFFQGVRLFGRNFNELTRFIRSRGHRGPSAMDAGGVQVPSNPLVGNVVSVGPAASVVIPGQSTGGPGCPVGINAQGDNMSGGGGRTKEQVRLFYLQTWYKLRRYVKYADSVPQHVREVYAIINWSIMRARIKKPLDNRLGEKLNELVHYGSTCVKHNGRRFLIRTPVCPALKHINHISAPTQEFCFPDDVLVELVPSSQAVAWRVLEAEQNPRLRLRVDINRQLSDIISLVEAKWIFPTERISSLLSLSKSMANRRTPPKQSSCRGQEQLLLRFPKEQKVDGAISLREISRTRSVDISINAYQARQQEKAISQIPLTDTTIAPECENEVDNNDPTSAIRQSGEQAKPSETGTVPAKSISVPPLPPAYRATNSSVVHLDLREIGNRLIFGVTFGEARGIKLIVIYLALGCPGRIRFEYDFVLPIGEIETDGNALTHRMSICNDINGNGINNGLRRLLHLNANDYLSLKEWNTPNKSHSHGVSAATPMIRPRSDEAMHLPPASIQPLIPSLAATTTISTPHPTEATPISGHEAFLVCQPQGQHAKLFVARQLHVQGPAPSPPISATAFIAPQPIQQSSLTVTTSTPQQPAVTEAPKSSLHALRTFNRKQVQRSRVRQHTKCIATSTFGGTVGVSEATSLNTPPNSCRDHFFIVSPSPFGNIQHLDAQSTHTQHWTAEMAPQTGTPTVPSQTLADPHHQMQTEQSELAFPFSLDGYSHNSSTSDTMKSLLNAIMHTVPTTTTLSGTTDLHALQAPSDSLLMQQQSDFASEGMDLMPPIASEFNTNRKSDFCLLSPHDDSSLVTLITQNSQAMDGASLSDSLAHKISQEMTQASTDASLDKYEKQLTTDGAILEGGCDYTEIFQTSTHHILQTPPDFQMSSVTDYQVTNQQPSSSPMKSIYVQKQTVPNSGASGDSLFQFGSFSTLDHQ